MGVTTPINVSELFSGDSSDIFLDSGVPKYNRRMSDKVLAAFNHAYSVGEIDLARRLWECLSIAEEVGQKKYPSRRGKQSLELARLWIAFVDSRNAYRGTTESVQATPMQVSDSFAAMKSAYLEWAAHLRQI